METINKRLRYPDTSENALIQKLERSNKALQQLRKKLSSYICEPKTPKLYEQIEFLKLRLENLRNANTELMAALKNHGKGMEGHTERIKKQLKDFQDLQQSVLEYIGRARMHC